MEWDTGLETCEDLSEYTTNDSRVSRIVNKALFGTTPREFLDKRIFFKGELDEG